MNISNGASFNALGASAASITAPESSAGKVLPSILMRILSVQQMPQFDIR
jgi:hypothetical protein